ncbi:MAG: glycosyltransferase [Verrucomicrobiota bacterium]
MLSVIICTYNPREDYLRRTLESLRAQDLSPAEWELVLVDNNSTPALQEREPELVGWHEHGRLVKEDEQGLTAARVRGAREAQGDLIVYVDDDNELATDYLSQTLAIAAEHPHLGAWGPGVVEGDFETPPRPEVEPYLHLLLINRLERERWSNVYGDGVNPWGAGLAMRARVLEAFLSYFEEHRRECLRLGRKGSALLSAEDHLFLWLATELGLGKGLFPRLRLVHLIPFNRLEPDYLLRLMHGNMLSLARLSAITGFEPKVPHPIMYGLTCLNVWLKKGGFARQMYQARIRGLREGYADARDPEA